MLTVILSVMLILSLLACYFLVTRLILEIGLRSDIEDDNYHLRFHLRTVEDDLETWRGYYSDLENVRDNLIYERDNAMKNLTLVLSPNPTQLVKDGFYRGFDDI